MYKYNVRVFCPKKDSFIIIPVYVRLCVLVEPRVNNDGSVKRDILVSTCSEVH